MHRIRTSAPSPRIPIMPTRTHYRTALELQPDHETALYNLGVALEDLGRIDDAADAYRRAIALDGRNEDAHYNLAGIYERRGEIQAALRHLKAYRTLTS